jgi:hypothetical protein
VIAADPARFVVVTLYGISSFRTARGVPNASSRTSCGLGFEPRQPHLGLGSVPMGRQGARSTASSNIEDKIVSQEEQHEVLRSDLSILRSMIMAVEGRLEGAVWAPKASIAGPGDPASSPPLQLVTIDQFEPGVWSGAIAGSVVWGAKSPSGNGSETHH